MTTSYLTISLWGMGPVSIPREDIEKMLRSAAQTFQRSPPSDADTQKVERTVNTLS